MVEYDFGRQYPDRFRRTHDAKTTLGRPNREIRAVLSSLKTNEIHNKFHEHTQHHIGTLQAQNPAWGYPGTEHDVLYEASYDHGHRHDTEWKYVDCNPDNDLCDREVPTEDNNGARGAENVTCRSRLDEDTVNPIVHIGTIASADTVMKSGEHREKLAEVEGVIGFEMEGAGVWDNLPCVIIKGVCDYADNHKNKVW